MTKTFPSIAEAVAHYASQGYSTVEYKDRSRVMERRDTGKRLLGTVVINKEDFLSVAAVETLR